MKKYEKVQEILKNAAMGANPHHDGQGRFWEKSLNEFKGLVIYNQKLIADAGPNRGARSGIIKALRGEAPFDNSMFNRMPSGLPPVSPQNIQFIQSWINDGLPDEELDESTSEPDSSGSSDTTDDDAPIPPVTLPQTNAFRNSSDQPRVRKNINKLTESELANYKSAIAQIKALPDSDIRSFNYWGNIHGQSCRHGSQVFLPWHRAYLISFENTLRKFVPGVTIPYWDWVNDREIPEAFKGDDTNPLYNEKRSPGTPGFGYMPTKEEWNETQEVRTWNSYGGAEFSNGTNERNTHNPMHGWIGGPGGDMTSPPSAALDPIFWSFHCSVDRQWDLWQKLNTGVGPTTQLDYILQPFSMMVNQVLTVEQLSYEYASAESMVKLDASTSHTMVNITGGQTAASPEAAQTITRVKPPKYIRRLARLQFHQVRHPKESYCVYIFVNQPDADYDTPIEDNPHYAGRFTIWGHGECVGGVGHCDVPYNPRATGVWHHLNPFDIECDISECVERLGVYAGDLDVKLVIKVDKHKGKSKGGLQCDQISIVSGS